MDWAAFITENIPEPETVTVEVSAGVDGAGEVWAAPVTVSPCVVDETRRAVRVQTGDAAGRVVMSSTTVWAPLATVCPAGSRVSYNGRTATVLAASQVFANGHDLPEHLEISLE